jgi:hypothetical protein
MKSTLHFLKTLPMLMVVFGCAAVTLVCPEFSEDSRKRSKLVSAEESGRWKHGETAR